MKAKNLFVWDLHGTLEKGNVHAVQELVNLVLEESGVDKEITIRDAMDWYGLSWFDYFKLAVPEGNSQLWKFMVDKVLSLQQRGWDIIKKHIKPRDFVDEVLKTIKQKGHQNILLSNTAPQHVRTFTDLLNITQYFESMIGVDNHFDSRIDKDTRNLKSEALANFIKDKEYKKVILIGDREGDIKAGKNCGAITYLLVDPELKEYVKKINTDHTISDLREVLKEL